MKLWLSAGGSDTSTVSVVGIMAGITTALTALFLFGRGVRSVWRTIRRANDTIDSLQEIIKEWREEKPTGSDPGKPSIPTRIANIERALAAHIQHHSQI